MSIDDVSASVQSTEAKHWSQKAWGDRNTCSHGTEKVPQKGIWYKKYQTWHTRMHTTPQNTAGSRDWNHKFYLQLQLSSQFLEPINGTKTGTFVDRELHYLNKNAKWETFL